MKRKQVFKKRPMDQNSKRMHAKRQILTQESIDEMKSKWLHHRLKVLRRALKKAKAFELLKVQRRIALAAAAQTGGDTDSNNKWAIKTDMSKLHLQGDVIKEVDLDHLAQRAMQRCGLLKASVDSASDITSPSKEGIRPLSGDSSNLPKQLQQQQLEVIEQRLLRSGAVKKEVLSIVADFNDRFKTRHQAPQEGQGEQQRDDRINNNHIAVLRDSPDSTIEEKDPAGTRTCIESDPNLFPADHGAASVLEDTKAEEREESIATGNGDSKAEEREESIATGNGDSKAEEREESIATGNGDSKLQSILNKLKIMKGQVTRPVEQGEDSADSGVIDVVELDSECCSVEGIDNMHRLDRNVDEDAEEDEVGVRNSEQEWTTDACVLPLSGNADIEAESEDDSLDSAEWDIPADVSQVRSRDVEIAAGTSNRAVETGHQKSVVRDERKLHARETKGCDKGVSVGMKSLGPEGAVKVAKCKKKGTGGSTDPLLIQKKNRLGQHARRKLAEEKFGKAAKHLKMQEREQGQVRYTRPGIGEQQGIEQEHLHPSWAAKRKQSGAILSTASAAPKKIKFDEDAAPEQKRTHDIKMNENVNNAKMRSGRSSSQAVAKGNSSGPLHPSWEAHKKRKAEMAEKASLPTVPTGKKTLFDD
ncbi:hypothetical protein CEUSTIGMA_g13153.t1 [Chlamydomonas eustigma]|uniref:Bud22 domain-containing protein n=1 Tax=Chlamydomonas eustigma TaxID=1157962 RepID=A0A250XRP9_9CHLO|nr:hypothetical protein CEUSTIGMA_g13153.t1 [Chlamydomonas eustigma]|eukprot:GAX85738.1 hypothetical protein CEUSTIGMA_g13153.t1 [Chlamydomonas eustigma]